MTTDQGMDAGQPSWQELKAENERLGGELQAARDYAEDQALLVGLIAEALGVPREPHQSFTERILESPAALAARCAEAERLRDRYRTESREVHWELMNASSARDNALAERDTAQEEADALAAHQAELVFELSACQGVLHSLAHSGQVTWEYADEAKAVLQRTPKTSLTRLTLTKQAEALEQHAEQCTLAAISARDDECYDMAVGMEESADRAREIAAEKRRQAEGDS